jgi:hypothetical protein
MNGVTLTSFFLGCAVGSAAFWGIPFGIAYWRRPFGGDARNYLLAFGVAWATTVLIFVVPTIVLNWGR